MNNILGRAVISAGLLITSSSEGTGIGGPMIMVGTVLCFHAAGVNSIDLQKQKIYTSACISIY